VEDADYGLPGVQYNRNGDQDYVGKAYTVRATPGCAETNYSSAWYEAQYVSRYELFWRADGGRAWHSLGVFRGNFDATTEVSHSFGGYRGGLRARYLRLVPLDCQNGGAVRVGVYGRLAGATPQVKRPRCGVVASDGEGTEELVTYTLTTVPESRSRTFARDGVISFGHDDYGRIARSAERKRRQQLAKRELDEYCLQNATTTGRDM